MSDPATFSPDYMTAQDRFRDAVTCLGWQLESHPIGVAGPIGEELTIDVGYSQTTALDCALVISSGLHGVEGFFGSAVQLELLEQWAQGTPPDLNCIFLHGLNPYGFAWLRRFDENNVDPNRNFLLPGERYEGVPAGYADLDGLLNPKRPPSYRELFTLKALWTIARYGMPALKQAIASGQYEFPRGLFFGGAGPSMTHHLLEKHLQRWLQGNRSVVHLDFHTGLGAKGAWKLLIDYTLSQQQRTWLMEWFGENSFEAGDSNTIAYDARGGLGRWCVSRKLAPNYLFACAEFGTYHPIQMLAGLRAENQAHHWGTTSSASTARAKHRLKELFCPSATSWRRQVLDDSLDLVARAIRGLSGEVARPGA